MEGTSAAGRALAYCVTPGCNQYAKGIFLLGTDVASCTSCWKPCDVKRETWELRGEPDPELLQRVELEFNWSNETKRYHSVAIIHNHACEGQGIYILRSPFMSTPKRALAMAEDIFGRILSGTMKIDGPPQGAMRVVEW